MWTDFYKDAVKHNWKQCGRAVDSWEVTFAKRLLVNLKPHGSAGARKDKTSYKQKRQGLLTGAGVGARFWEAVDNLRSITVGTQNKMSQGHIFIIAMDTDISITAIFGLVK